MIKKSLALEAPVQRKSLAGRMVSAAPVVALADLYSRVMEETVSPRRTLRLLNAQTAVLAVLFPAGLPVALRLLFALWAGVALLACRKRD